MSHFFGALFAASAQLILALPPTVPYEPFLEIGEQNGFEVIDPLSKMIQQLSAGPDLVLRPVSSKANVIAKVTSTWFNARGTHIIKIEADYWLSIASEAVFLSMLGGIQVNDTRKGGNGMCLTLGLIEPVKIFPGQPKVTFTVFLEPVPRHDDPYRKLSGETILPWFELESDYKRRTNVPSAAFEWDHVIHLSNYLHRTRAEFQGIDASYIKEVVDEAFSDGFAAATRATITRQWKECLEDLRQKPRPKHLWTRPAQIKRDEVKTAHQEDEKDAKHQEEVKQSRQTDVLVSAAGVITGAVLIQKSCTAKAVKEEPDVLDRGTEADIKLGQAAVYSGTEVALEIDECIQAVEEATEGEPGIERKRRQTRRGRGILRKKFQALPESEKPGSRADAGDEQSIPETASDLFGFCAD